MIIGIYFSSKEGEEGDPFLDPRYLQSYLDFASLAFHKGTTLHLFRHATTYQGNLSFSSGWIFSKNRFIHHTSPLTCNRLWYKGRNLDLIDKLPRNNTVINHPLMEIICTDKYETYKTFPSLCPQTIRIDHPENILSVQDSLQTDLMVIKPLTGSQGHDIQFVHQQELPHIRLHPNLFPLIIQEFIETAGGIPGLVTTRHDLRVIVMNGEIIQSYIRVPRTHPYLANVSQGGQLLPLPIKNIPTDMYPILSQIEKTFSPYSPRIYAADFGYTTKGPLLFEINSQPGMPFPEEPEYHFFHTKLLETLSSQ
jgi:hypothetical protein